MLTIPGEPPAASCAGDEAAANPARQSAASRGRLPHDPRMDEVLATSAKAALELPTVPERQCHNLRVLFGMNQQQIADVLDCQRETVSRRLKRFREKRRLIQRWAANHRLGPDIVESLLMS